MAPIWLGNKFPTTFRNISHSQPGVIFPSKPHFLVVTAERAYYWHLVCKGQGCCYTSYIVQDSVHNKELFIPKCQLHQSWETLRNAIHNKKYIFLFSFFLYCIIILVFFGGGCKCGVEDPFCIVQKRLQNNKKAILEDYSKRM